MKATNQNPAKTVLTISVGFGIIFLLTELSWTLYTSMIISFLSIISNKICKFVHYLWMKLAKILGLVLPNVLLSLVYFLLLFPIALLSKIFRRGDTLQLRQKENSFWLNRLDKIEKDSFNKMW